MLNTYYRDVLVALRRDFRQAHGCVHGNLVRQRVAEHGSYPTVRGEADYYADQLLGLLHEAGTIEPVELRPQDPSKAAFLGLQYKNDKHLKAAPAAGYRTCWYWLLINGKKL